LIEEELSRCQPASSHSSNHVLDVSRVVKQSFNGFEKLIDTFRVVTWLNVCQELFAFTNRHAAHKKLSRNDRSCLAGCSARLDDEAIREFIVQFVFGENAFNINLIYGTDDDKNYYVT